jgi:hypothetical protein
MPAQSKTPVKQQSGSVETRSSGAEVDAILARVNTLAPISSDGRGRLIFAMDATMSRQPTWDLALGLQADMFRAVKEIGGLDVQLVYFRGFEETRASKWVSDPEALARLMTRVSCQGGYTQIRKVLTHARRESEKHKVNAVIYVGDCIIGSGCRLRGWRSQSPARLRRGDKERRRGSPSRTTNLITSDAGLHCVRSLLTSCLRATSRPAYRHLGQRAFWKYAQDSWTEIRSSHRFA